MGWYINPKDMTKEEWLKKHRVFAQMHAPSTHYEADGDLVCICHVDNGGFTAAGICVGSRELQDFARDDGRSKLWFHVPYKEVEPFLFGKEIEGRTKS